MENASYVLEENGACIRDGMKAGMIKFGNILVIWGECM